MVDLFFLKATIFYDELKWVIGTFLAFILGGAISWGRTLQKVQQLQKDRDELHEIIKSHKDEVKKELDTLEIKFDGLKDIIQNNHIEILNKLNQ